MWRAIPIVSVCLILCVLDKLDALEEIYHINDRCEADALIPVEFHRYPEHQMLEALGPDFLYGSYTSAFESTRINYTNIEAVSGTECSLVYQHSSKGELRSCRPDLHDAAIGTYLQEGACEHKLSHTLPRLEILDPKENECAESQMTYLTHLHDYKSEVETLGASQG
eukprot:1146309-Pelagomonas_calceolata.AAC.2